MDVIGWAIVTLHNLLGHDKTAYVLDQDPGDKAVCVICRYERYPSLLNRQAVLDALETGMADPVVFGPDPRPEAP